MQSYYIMQLAFYDSFLSTKPSQPYSYTYGDRPVFELCFLPNEIAEGDTLVFAVDNDMVFYDHTPENLLHSASCMVVVRHDVTAEEATAGKVQLRIETRTVKFRDVTNGKVRPVEVISGLYRRRGNGDDLNYVLMAKGRAFANGIIADYDALPEPITIDEYYTKGDIDGLLGEKADESALVAHTDNADIHVTLQDKSTWDSKADVTDIGNATVTITQGGVSKGSFSVNASENVTIDLTGGGAQADWNETDTSSPSYIQNKPSVYTKTETDAKLDDKADKTSVYTKTETDGLLDGKADKTSVYTKTETDALLNEKADKTSVYTKGETDGLLNEKADVATTLSGYGIQDAYTKTETDALLDAKADKATTYTKTETDGLLDGKAEVATTYTKTETNSLLDAKANVATTLSGYGIQDAYTKTETDGLFDGKADATSVYTKTETNSLLDAKADKTSTYTKTETNTFLDVKADKASTYTKDETDGLLDGKANVATTYTKTETDNLLDAKADKATTIAGYGITDAYTKTEVDAKVTSVYRYRGTVSTYADLPSSGQEVGDVWNIETADSAHGIKAGDNVAWNGTTWDVLAGEIDLTAYPTKSELATVATTGNYNDLSNRPSLDFVKNYFTVTAKQADSTVRMMTMRNVIPDIEYSTDGGTTWTQLVFTKSELNESLYFSQTITLENNAKALFRGNNHTIGNGWTGVSRFLFTGQVAVSGKLMSLLDKSCASDTVPNDVTTGVLASLFSCANWSDVTFDDNMYALVDASELVFPINSYDNAYMNMFANCKGLTNVPNCFCQGANVSQGLREMFVNSGIAGKVILGLTGQLASSVYTGTFEGCTGITKAEILNCIPAQYSFLDTFEGCTNLTEITVHFTEWNDSWQWRGAPATGVWRCPKALDTTKRGMTGIPDGWTVKYIDEQSARADWSETDTSSPAYIKNKPDIIEAPAAAGTVGQVLTKTADGQEWDALPDTTDYLCFTADEANDTISLNKYGTPDAISLEYSVDKKTWTDYTWDGNTGATITLANVGDSVYFRGNNSTFSKNYDNYYNFQFSALTRASGNVMSLLDRELRKKDVPEYCFSGLFYNCTSLTTAPELPATTLTESCYYNIFGGSGIVVAPELPATTLGGACYRRMFDGCTSLTEAPELPATTLANWCYVEMFKGCTSLTTAPELPATTIGESSYRGMFDGCTSLTTAPKIYAKSGDSNSCNSMFYNCTSLTEATVPNLNLNISNVDTVLQMFHGCTSLKHLKVYFTNWDGYGTYVRPWDGYRGYSLWLEDASSTGVFECPSALDCSIRDTSHVPAGWTIVRTDSPKSITSPTTASSEATYDVSPNTPSVPVVTVASALTLNASATIDIGSIAYAEIVLDVATGATVTAGTNLTLVDEITAGKRNICVVRWSNGVAKLYVTIVEDLPQA